MNIYQAIENYHLDQPQITDELRTRLLKSYPDREWIQLTQTFLAGLDHQHGVAGRDIQRLYDYMRYYQEHDRWTWSQQWHLAAIIIENWNHMSCWARARLDL